MELTGTGFLCSRPRLSPMLGASAKGKESIVFSREGCVCVCVYVLGRGRRGNEKQINSNLAYKEKSWGRKQV